MQTHPIFDIIMRDDCALPGCTERRTGPFPASFDAKRSFSRSCGAFLPDRARKIPQDERKDDRMPEKNPEKEKALELAVGQIEKAFGKGSIMKLGENTSLSIEAIPTGSIALDMALGVGGVPKGRIIEIYGPESSGKTTLALHILAQCQKQGGTGAFIDAEHALDPVYAQALGVDIDSLLVSQPDTGEQALQIAEMLIRSGAVDVIIVDSVAALVPRAEIEGEMGDSHVGIQARLMSQALRKLAGALSKSNCVAVFINQLREKIGIMFGNPETTTGGRALKFYASVRLDIRKGEAIMKNGEAVGSRTKVKIVKNKVAPPFREVEFDIMYGRGISRDGEILDLGVALEAIKKSGAFFYYKDQRIGQGRDNARQFITDNPEIAAQIEEEIYKNKDRFLFSKGGFKVVPAQERQQSAGSSAGAQASAQPADGRAAAAPRVRSLKNELDIDIGVDD